MPALRRIWFWPAIGNPDRPWLGHPDLDAFARSANSVCELYSEAVHRARMSVRHSELRLFCRRGGRRDDVLVEVYPDVTEGFEMAVAFLPPGIAALAPPARARLVLEVVHAAAMRLGGARGWDTTALTAAHAHTLAAGLRYRWDGPSKISPDRRHVAQPRYLLGDDGFGRVVLQIRRRDDGTVVCASPVAAVWGSSRSFAEHARTVRWRSTTLVQFQPDDGVSIGTTGTDRSPVIVDLADPASFGEAVELPPAEYHDAAAMIGIPAVVVQAPADTL